MSDVFDHGPSTRDTARDNSVEARLASMIDIHGLPLIDDPERIWQMLIEALPDASRSIAAIRVASLTGVASRLAEARDDDRLPVLLQASVDILKAQGGLDTGQAVWSVQAWAHALALPTPGLEAVVATPASPVSHEAPILVEPSFTDRDPHGIAHDAEAPAAFAPTAADALPRMFAGDAPSRDSFVPPPWKPPSEERSFTRPVTIAVVLLIVAIAAWFGIATILDSNEPANVAALRIPAPGTKTPAAVVPPVTTSAPGSQASSAVQADPEPVDVAPPQSSPLSSPLSTPLSTPDPTPDPAPLPAPEPTPTRPVENAPPATKKRPVIAQVEVPQVVEGAPFSVLLRPGTDSREIVGIERRIVATSGIWPKSGAVTRANGLRSAENGDLLVPFRAMDAPAHATIVFTAIGRDGTRSGPQTATIDVAEPVRVASGPSPGACTRSTCGTVVDAREIAPEFDTREGVYQVVVQMDDRDTRTFTAPYRFQAGSRVRRVGERFVPLVPGRP